MSETVSHRVIEVRATGVTPEAVSQRMQEVFDEQDAQGWRLQTIQPVIYNSSTTGYFLLIFARSDAGHVGQDSD